MKLNCQASLRYDFKMKKSLLIFSTFALTFSTIRCVPKDFYEPGKLSVSGKSTSHSYNASFNDVWKAVTQAAAAKRYAVSSSIKDSGILVTDWISGKSDRLYSGYGDSRIPYNIRFKFTINVKPTKRGIVVSIKNDEQYMTDAVTSGSDFQGSLYQWVSTDSSTEKESLFLTEIDNQLAVMRVKGK